MFYSKLLNKKRAAAMTLTELMLVIALGLILVAGIGYGVSKVRSSTKLLDAQNNLLVLRMQIQQLFTGSSDYSELTTALALKSGSVPQIFVKGDKIVNPWGGTITLDPSDTDAAFIITFGGVPQDECTKLGIFQPDSWLEVDINGTVIPGGSVAEVSNACTGANTIKFTAR